MTLVEIICVLPVTHNQAVFKYLVTTGTAHEGQTVWEYVNPHFGPFLTPWRAAATPRGYSAFTGEHNAVFRAFRYAAADLPALR